jgi:adenylate cyclase
MMSKRIPIFLGILLTAFAIWLLLTPTYDVKVFLERLDNIGYDLQLRTKTLTQHATPSSSVAIIDIDDKSLKAVGQWPWSRNKVAELTTKLQQLGATIIAFDMFFSEKENNISETLLAEYSKRHLLNASLEAIIKENAPLFDNDAIFAQSLSTTSTVLAVGFLPRDQTQNLLPPPLLALTPKQQQLGIITAKGYISNIPILQKAAKGIGFINIYPDSDGIIRHAPLILQYKNGIYPSLALEAVLAFLDQDIALITPHYGDSMRLEGIQIGATVIPVNARGEVYIPFIGKSFTFPYYSAIDVLQNNIPKDALLGKILFVGTSATGLGDLKATAIQNPFPGVEVQATLVNGLLENNFSYKPEWTNGANVVITLLFGLLAAWIFPYLGPRSLGLVIVVLPPSLIFINNYIWDQTGLVLSFLLPVMLVLISALLNILYGYLFETRRREHLKTMFGQYVPAKHIDEMLKATGGNFGLRGEDREMSVLFADIRGFTTISEGLNATELVNMLNTFFTPMTEIIFNHQGTIDKYVGDLIMAFWGAPLKDKLHAKHAIESALEMQVKVKEMHATFAANHWPAIHIGIGINSGNMSVGDMGSRYRRNYTVLGDAVNLASRVESLTKFYGVDIMVTEATETQQTKFVFRQLDRVRVKGKQTGINIYEVICKQADASANLKQELETYHQALQHYFAQRWDDAFTLIAALHQQHPHTKIYKIYIERITEFKANPLPADWDGVYVHAAK